jgi:E3 ubiquitin-protein ligase DOA10
MNTQEPPAYCRICYESNEDLRNPLLVACDCRGSLQHIHRKCLLRWVVGGSEEPETVCHLCRVPYRVAPVHQLERMPRTGAAEVVLRNPVLLVLAIHYILAAFLNSVPAPLRRVRFVVWASIVHCAIHWCYLLLFITEARTRNVAAYLYQWARYYMVVPGFHWMLYTLYKPQYYELGYLADLWLGAYWFVHLRILRSINEAILA